MTPTIPAPTPELYEKAAEMVDKYGWEACTLTEGSCPEHPMPCCVN